MRLGGDLLYLGGNLAEAVIEAEIPNADTFEPAHRQVGEIYLAGD